MEKKQFFFALIAFHSSFVYSNVDDLSLHSINKSQKINPVSSESPISTGNIMTVTGKVIKRISSEFYVVLVGKNQFVAKIPPHLFFTEIYENDYVELDGWFYKENYKSLFFYATDVRVNRYSLY